MPLSALFHTFHLGESHTYIYKWGPDMKWRNILSIAIIISASMSVISCGEGLIILLSDDEDIAINIELPGSTILPPAFNLPSGTYSDDIAIEITAPTDGTEIYYTDDNTQPSINSKRFNEVIIVAGNMKEMTLRAITVKGDSESPESAVTYKINYNQVSTPQFVVVGMTNNQRPGGMYHTDIDVMIECKTAGATMYYKIDGSAPAVYSSPIHIDGFIQKMTITAYAIMDPAIKKMIDSEIVEATFIVEYLIVAKPVFDPPSGTYIKKAEVKITTSTIGAKIKYTTDGSDPQTSPTAQIGHNISVKESMTIRAFAFNSGMWDSDTVEAVYVIQDKSADVAAVNGNDSAFSIGKTDGYNHP